MRKGLLIVIALLLCSTSAFAEATFDQIQGLIKAHDYAAAIQGLQIIIQNHPRSAKAYYAMSQAQAGVGNQVKAKEALDMATGIDPSLKFASSGNVEKLKDAIQPQTKKIEAIESHTLRNCILFLLVAGGIAAFFYFRKRKGEGPEPEAKPAPRMIDPPRSPSPYQQSKAAHEAIAVAQSFNSERPAFRARPYIPPVSHPSLAPVHHTTVVNNSGGSDLVTGMVLGSMMHGSHERHTVVEREYIREEPVRETPAPSRSSSWDDDRSSSSSSWDSGSSSSSSSWGDSSSSSSSSSSWDSSSDSSSSSSWD